MKQMYFTVNHLFYAGKDGEIDCFYRECIYTNAMSFIMFSHVLSCNYHSKKPLKSKIVVNIAILDTSSSNRDHCSVYMHDSHA